MSLIVRGSGRPGAYLLASGARVPSVTTITGARKSNVEGLLFWANQLGRPTPEYPQGRDHRDARQKAADAGSLAHSMVENAIHGRDELEGIPETEADVLAQARQGLQAWRDWSRVMKVDYVLTETPMVSEKYAYGGTPDAVGHVDGKLALIDWKTGNAVYGDAIIQMAAYRELWNEVYSESRGTLEAYYLLRFGKDHGDYHVHAYPSEVIAMGWRAFLHLRELYELDKALKKVAG